MEQRNSATKSDCKELSVVEKTEISGEQKNPHVKLNESVSLIVDYLLRLLSYLPES